ncbi:MAG TPA: RodZ domain-containing protein, partial [Pseudomonadales bacterium]|nr:RodZ domain-containing protein [Pseudomonadales bacterium]
GVVMSELSPISSNRENAADSPLKPDGRMLTLLPGQRLRAARERLKLSQQEIAEQLKLPKRTVIAIELDDYASMPNRTFARGYLRAYARIVKISPEEISAAYDQVTNRADERSSLVVANLKNEPLFEGSAFSIINSILVGILVILLIVAGLWAGERWLNTRHQDAMATIAAIESANTEVEPRSLASEMMASSSPRNDSVTTIETNPLAGASGGEAPVASVPAAKPAEPPAQPVDINMQPLVPSEVKPAAPVTEEVTPTAPAAAASLVASLPITSVAPSGLSTIAMSFPGFCWVQIKDADGAVLEEGTKSAGAVLNLQGKAPFAIRLGNPPAATLHFNGQAVDLASYPAKKQIRLLCSDNQCQQISR